MKQVAVLSVLLAAALAGTYVSWFAEETDPSKDDQIVVYRADASDLAKVAWIADDESVVIERKLDAAGEYLWVTVTTAADEPEPAPEPEPGAEGEPPTSAPPAEPEVVTFKGNETADTLWADFAPLYALRELTTTGAASSAAFGFDEPTATIEIGRRSGALSLVVGGETYGSKDRYVQLEERVYLVDDAALRPLEFGKTRLIERLLQPLAESDTDRVTLTRADRSVSFVHENREDRATEFWARSDAPTEQDEAAKTFLGKVMRMRIQEFVAGPEPVLTPAFAFAVEGDGQSWAVEVFTGDDGQYYARSSFTRGLVKLTESLASETIADIDTVLPLEEG